MTPSASRSLTEPSGLKASILTKRFTWDGANLLIFTTGVRPIVSRMFRNFAIASPSRSVGHLVQNLCLYSRGVNCGGQWLRANGPRLDGQALERLRIIL